LDENFHEVPPGHDGEVCFCGHFLASGYLNDKTATKERFLPDPFGEGQMYRTGDVGRWAPDPAEPSKLVLHLVGRMDRQTNIRGIRVSPEDVEVVIREVPGVKESAVVVASAEGQDQCLAAFVEPTLCSDGVDLEQSVKDHCSQSLPQHMRPASISCHKDLPKLANGKVDLKALEQKASALIESEPKVLDSLGMMRKAGKDAVQQESAMSSSRGIAIIAVMVFHLLSDKNIYPDLWAAKLLFDSMFRLDWSMYVFALQSGFQDRVTDQNKMSGQWRGNLLVFLLLLVTNGPIQWTLNVICRAVSPHPNQVDVQAGSPIRWYLYFYLVCRCLSVYVLTPCEWRLSKSRNQIVRTVGPMIMTLSVTALAWWGHIHIGGGRRVFMIPNLCPGFSQNSRFVHIMRWFLPNVTVSSSEELAHCQLVPHMLFLWCLAAYTAAWWYAKDIIQQVKMRSRLVAIGPIPTATAFIVVAMTYLQFRYLLPAVMHKIWDLSMNLILASILILSCALADQTNGLHRMLAFAGRFSLGTYVFHLYFLSYHGVFSRWGLGDNNFVPQFYTALTYLDSAGPWKIIPQVIIMFAYCFGFVVIIGAPLQIFVTESFNRAIEKGQRCLLGHENQG